MSVHPTPMMSQSSGKSKVYIATLGVLAPYRGYGIGTKLLQRSLAGAAKDSSIEEAYLHVQVCAPAPFSIMNACENLKQKMLVDGIP